MEKWQEYKKGIIVKDDYETSIEFGEENGLIIDLIGKKAKYKIIFGNVFSFRVIEEGYVQTDIYSEDKLEKYRNDGFSNVIYSVIDGKYALDIDKISGGYANAIGYHHYVLVTLNYNIDIVSSGEAEIQSYENPIARE